MICSTCGYENQVGNRFCGMCGIPLPHRPLTTPGAQSTASLARPLVENGRSRELRPPASPARVAVDVESGRSNGDNAASEIPELVELQSRESMQRAEQATPPQFDLVPEIPLDEYVQSFRYVPPDDPEEKTMRAEAPVLEPDHLAPADTASVKPPETAVASAELRPVLLTDDVRDRLGLEVDGSPEELEERTDRPRFLDFNEPFTPPKSETPEAPVAGPSYLGLTDAPEAEAEPVNELVVEEPARGKWRVGLATAAVLVVGFLGALEWRAQVRQTNNGPIEVIKRKMQELTHNKPTDSASTESATPAAGDSISKSEAQVEAPPKSQSQNPAAGTTTSAQVKNPAANPNAAAATTPLASLSRTPAVPDASPPAGQSAATTSPTPAPNTAQAPVGQTAAAGKTPTPADKSKTVPLAASSAPSSADKPKPSPQGINDGGEVVTKKAGSGAEEMAKANHASDSVAEAAWLWKATAKGNPDAPVRLADLYVKGDGVPRSCEQAMVLLKTAAEKENAWPATGWLRCIAPEPACNATAWKLIAG